MMEHYAHQVLSLTNPSFQSIQQIAKKNCGANCPCQPWSVLNHGVDLLETHEKLCKYLCAYGNMHEEKMEHAFATINENKNFLNQDLTIIDWGCGQGLATLCFFDYLKHNHLNHKTKKVILIEPSQMALNRAKVHVTAYLKDEEKIRLVNKYLDNVTKEDTQTTTPVVLHFFSNILDIQSVDLKKLALNVGNDSTKDHYLFCTTPLNHGNRRIEAFYNYFNEPKKIANKEVSALPKTKKTLKLLVFKLEAGKINLIHVEYYPPVQFHAGYQLDCLYPLTKELSQEDKHRYHLTNVFEISAPFDIGASIYDDVQPIFAVLNNIITRGLPTRTSPFIEQVFKSFGNEKIYDDLGNIKYGNDKLHPNNLLSSIHYLTPISVARVQKTILEAMMTNKISIGQSEWNILVTERDVPCAAIAIEDLKQMFEHLTALSKDYSAMKFPEIKLDIVTTSEFANSPLHLNIKPTTDPSSHQRLKEYDMVIDVSVLLQLNLNTLSFSEFKCKNNCYFTIRSASQIRCERHIYTSDTIEYRPLVTKDAQGNYKDLTENKAHLQYFLQLLFRKKDFRPGQLPILNRALQNKSVIGLLPTGGGKSLTYQLAAMLQPGVTIVIDPLRSLMKDQYDGLRNVGIDTCTFINSTLSAQEKDNCEKQMESSQMQFVFLSPERLCIYKFRERLKTMHNLHVYFAYGVIDEVHCVSEWGHDFRFSYLHLGRNLYNYVCTKNQSKHLTLFGLTATASFDVLADVERELSGNGAFPIDADTIVRYENTNRLELQYKIERVPIEFEPDKFFDKKNLLNGFAKPVNISDKWAVFESKQKYLKDYILRIPEFVNDIQSKDCLDTIKKLFTERQNITEDLSSEDLSTTISIDMFKNQASYSQAGIVFCPHKDNTGIAVFTNSKSLNHTISQVGTFVGSSNDEDQNNETDKNSFDNLEKFRDNRLPLMVATKAFGMGIDKPNVRFTVNMNYSSSLESFVQEAGRAGRDRRIALSTILFADYKLIRINQNCPLTTFPLGLIKNKWFKEEDLQTILHHYNISIDQQYFDLFTPEHDLVKLRCEVSNQIFAFGECEIKCTQFHSCSLKNVPKEAKGFHYFKDLEETLRNQGIEIPKKNLEYVSADYETVMFFYNNNFKGSLLEKQKMHEILSKSETKFFLENDEEIKPNQIESVNNFLNKLLSVEVDTELVAFISYNNNYADYAKAIYRMCCIELIDDFTQDYSNHRFRIVTKRKADGNYYQGLKRFLTRYYSADRAEEEILKVPNYRGDNEVHKCLGYLTEFIYDKIAIKRKRAIDDMRTFCIQGLDDTKDWKEVNEDLKDFIYYYFNSKYAKDDYVAENGEAFSLTEDTDRGKSSNSDTVFKYVRVIDDDLVGVCGTPKDNVKHLQGAVRLLRRSLTDNNPALDLLNAFCLLYLGTHNNETLEEELHRSYQDGLIGFLKVSSSYRDFWSLFEDLQDAIAIKANEYPTEKLNGIKEEVAANIHARIIRSLTSKYIAE